MTTHDDTVGLSALTRPWN